MTIKTMMATLACTLMTALPQLAPAQGEQEVNVSLANEARAAIRRGVEFLLEKQAEDGSWLQQPAITGLAVIALHESGLADDMPEVEAAVASGRQAILKTVQDDGAIVADDRHYVNYSTAVCLSALAVINHPDDVEVMRKTRHFLIDSQLDEDHAEHPTAPDNPFYGGIGYGSAGPKRPDLSNTQWALEALHLTSHLDEDTKYSEKAELAWDHALQFLEAVQNVPENADKTWVVSDREDPNNDGGFIYKPTASKVNEKLQKQGQDVEGLRSYGSMTYAGLKSMIYAELDKDDYRVKAAVDWARKHYNLEENPVMGAEGHYYYLQTFAKAMDAYGTNTLKTADGKVRNWREDLLRQLVELQKQDGHWSNEKNARWMESIPELVTSYALIAMEVALDDQLETE